MFKNTGADKVNWVYKLSKMLCAFICYIKWLDNMITLLKYKTYNAKFLAIVKDFKIWQNHLKGCKYKVFVFINHNYLCCFINKKNLSFY